MRYLLLAALVACGGNGNNTPDAPSCPLAPVGMPTCAVACGNGQLDQCYTPTPPGGESADPCTRYPVTTELCDGATISLTCEQYGYLGGSAACTGQCGFDDRACESCASGPRILGCAATSVAPLVLVAPASTSGSRRIALVGGGVTIVDLGAQGLQQVAQVSGFRTAAGIPDGWLAASQSVETFTLSHIDLDGNVTPGATISQAAITMSMAYGPGGHTLVAWVRTNVDYELWFAVADASGALVTQPTMLVKGADMSVASATSDGSSFFVAVADGGLYRIAADGTVLGSTQGFPSGHNSFGTFPVTVTADATGGWYVVATDATSQTFIVQRFDALGAATGSAITIAPTGIIQIGSFVADGSDLAMAVSKPVANGVYSEQLVRVDATGAVVDSFELGRGGFLSVLASFGSDFAATFTGAGLTPRLVAVTH